MQPPQHVLRPERTTHGTQQRQKKLTLAHMRIALHSVLNCNASPSCRVAPAHNAVPCAPLCPRRNEENIAASPSPRVHSDTSRAWLGNVSLKIFGMVTAISHAARIRKATSVHATNPAYFPHIRTSWEHRTQLCGNRQLAFANTDAAVRKHRKPHARRDDVLPSLCSAAPAIRCCRLQPVHVAPMRTALSPQARIRKLTRPRRDRKECRSAMRHITTTRLKKDTSRLARQTPQQHHRNSARNVACKLTLQPVQHQARVPKK